jgi:hypothetical protein
MGLWDESSGKDLQWKQITGEANRRVCDVLRSFVSARLPRYPTGEKMFLQARDALYAYSLAANSFYSQEIERGQETERGLMRLKVRLKDRLLALNPDNYLRLVCALHTLTVVSIFLGNREDPSYKSWFYLFSEGIGDIYGCPDSYMQGWYEKLDWLADPQSGAARTAFKAYGEISPILGLAERDAGEAIVWSGVAVQIQKMAKLLTDRPDWTGVVEAELSATDECVRALDRGRALGLADTEQGLYMPVDCGHCGAFFTVHEVAYRQWRSGRNTMACPHCMSVFTEGRFAVVRCATCGVESGLMPVSLCEELKKGADRWRCWACLTRDVEAELQARTGGARADPVAQPAKPQSSGGCLAALLPVLWVTALFRTLQL